MPGSATISWFNIIASTPLTLFGTDTDATIDTNQNSNTISSVPANSLLVVTMANNNDSNTNPIGSITSSPSLTWVKQADASSPSSGNCEIWTAFFNAGGSITVTPTWDALVAALSSCLYAFTNSELTLGGASTVETGETAPSTNITTTRDSSYVIGVISDWNAINGARTYRNGETELLYDWQDTYYTGYHFYKLVATAGANTFGVSAPSGQSSGVCLLEIRGA